MSIFSKITLALLVIVPILYIFRPAIIVDYPPSKVSIVKTDIESIKLWLELFRAENFSFPTTDEGLQALVSNPNLLKYPNHRKYTKKLPIEDPWGNSYKYFNTNVLNGPGSIEVISWGPDGIQSEDDIKIIIGAY